ncbi:MAG TPA: rhodanese-like domain-containing protein, partial [Balneolaceae bacterium]|nr:rhodanese-like domain-containing protein [Balneolaceae bacterium]
ADDDKIDDLTRKLMRIGLDNCFGYISNVEALDLQLETADYIGYDDFKPYVGKPGVQIVDVRGDSEFKLNHIPGADHVFIGTLQNNLDKIDNEKEIIVHCQSGTRSTVAYSILRKNGFTKVKNFTGGMKEWLDMETAKKVEA